jgi:hypothetical protein
MRTREENIIKASTGHEPVSVMHWLREMKNHGKSLL